MKKTPHGFPRAEPCPLSVNPFVGDCDKQLRDAVCDFTGDSHRANPWADHLYRQAIARKHDHPHAVRILARAWLYVIWHCWQNGRTYDPTKHRALQTCSTKINNGRRLDTGQLMGCRARLGREHSIISLRRSRVLLFAVRVEVIGVGRQ